MRLRLAPVVVGVARRPGLWPTAVRVWWRTTPRGWWRHRPFLPVPSGSYLRFRLLTQYGSGDRSPTEADVLDYLSWCRRHDGAA